MSTKFTEILFLSILIYYDFAMGNYAAMMQLICGFDAAVIYNPQWGISITRLPAIPPYDVSI